MKVFPNAVIIFDRFHVMKPVNEELNKIRKQAQIKVRARKFILLKNGEDLSEEEKIKLDDILSRSKRRGMRPRVPAGGHLRQGRGLRSAYEWKEEFREIYEKSTTVEEGKVRLEEWLNKAQLVYCEAITTIRNHLDGAM